MKIWSPPALRAAMTSGVFGDLRMNPSLGELTSTSLWSSTALKRGLHLRYACSELTPIQVDYIPYLDSLAEQVGVRPNILCLLLKDPRLALHVLLGPCTSYQYRLTGPGQWAGARQAIVTQWERVLQPFRTRVVPEPEPESERRPSSKRSIVVIFSAAALLCCFVYNKHCPSSTFPLTLYKSWSGLMFNQQD